MLEKFRSSGVNTGRIKVNENIETSRVLSKEDKTSTLSNGSWNEPGIKASQFTASRFHTTRI